MSIVVATENLSCKSGMRYLIHNINWTIKEGDHWIVFGMNGSGKTTLLSIIAGFNRYTSGNLQVFGETYNDANILDIRKRIGWISSSFFDKYLSWESAIDIVLSGLTGTLSRQADVPTSEIKYAQYLLEGFRLGTKIDQPFALMSKGERQCVLIARALVSNPEILILDEPGTGLDIYAREYILKIIENLALNTNMTLIYVTHYAEEILPEFDKTLLLRSGRQYKQGATKDLFTSDVMADFLGYEANVLRRGDRIDIDLDLSQVDTSIMKEDDV